MHNKFYTIVLAILILSIFYIPVSAVSEAYRPDELIEEAISVGLVPSGLQNSYSDGITRAEFAHIAVSFMHIMNKEATVPTVSPFSDTDDTNITAAYAMGLINGRGDGTFAPDDTITRQEAAKVLANTYRAYTGTEAHVADEPTFADNADIAEWAYEDIGIMLRLGVMNGTGDCFEPHGLYTREQCIVTFLRLYEHITSASDVKLNNKNTPITDFLRASDGKLISGGKEIVLKGVNLGGWMILETWMSPVSDPNEEMAYSDVIKALTERFGSEKAAHLTELYEDNFITNTDFEIIEGLGFNCVRVPFWYRNFLNPDGTPREDNRGFELLDRVIEQCEKHGLWVILDMHGCPGGQSMNHSTGIIGNNGLYGNETNLSRMEQLWVSIAERYKDVKCIAAYDIMNEPQNNSGYSGPRAWQAESDKAVELTNAVYDRMIKAIRRVDYRHIISIEGIWSTSVLPDPSEYGWKNMLYQLHIYDDTAEMIDYRTHELTAARQELGVAVIAGEYNSGKLQRYASDLFDKNKISRIKWTYKTVGNKLGGWGLYGKPFEKIDIEKASYAEIEKAFGEEMRTENGFIFNIDEYMKVK